MLLLTADLAIVDANEAFLAAVGRKLEDMIGHNIFEEFPKQPEHPGEPQWTALEEAMTSGRRQIDKLSRYDIEDPAHPGWLEEHWATTVAQPIRGSDGHVQMIELSTRDVTPIIGQYRAMQREDET